MNIKFKRGAYAYADSLLHRFPLNQMRMQELMQALHFSRTRLDVHAQNYGPITSASGVSSSPVDRIADRIFALEDAVARLERKIVPVLRLRNSIKNSPQEHDRVQFFIMELHYFEGMALQDVMLHIGRRSIAFMRHERRMLIERLIKQTDDFSSSR